jgi:outer membrane protein assembly factor BamD
MKYLSFLLLAGLLAACSPAHDATPDSPEIHFQEAEAYQEKGLYNEAIASWEKVRDSFYSPELTMLAEFKLAETYYLDERYPEAASAYRDFLNQYPGDQRRAAATYWLGMSYFQQMLSADRDQTSTRNALTAFNDLLRLYPGEKDEQEIRSLIEQCRNRMAAHEVYVGRFYLRSKQYPSAIKRLEDVLQQYPDYTHNDESYYYLVTAYLRIDDRSKAEAVFKDFADAYPDSPYLLKAQKKLVK